MTTSRRSPRKFGIWEFIPTIEMRSAQIMILEPDAPETMTIVHDVARIAPKPKTAVIERAEFAVKVAGFSR